LRADEDVLGLGEGGQGVRTEFTADPLLLEAADWIDGASHVDLYDKEPYVGPAVEKLTDFFRAQLADAE
ncbi:hypothetical protein ACWDAZ_30530, partial [Streptomyces sp. NPDC001215]